MSHKEYSAKLEELNIFINSKNFLVYQGKVEEIALKNAKERMHMFEEISESVQFKEDYIKVWLAIENLRRDCIFIWVKALNHKVDRVGFDPWRFFKIL